MQLNLLKKQLKSLIREHKLDPTTLNNVLISVDDNEESQDQASLEQKTVSTSSDGIKSFTNEKKSIHQLELSLRNRYPKNSRVFDLLYNTIQEHQEESILPRKISSAVEKSKSTRLNSRNSEILRALRLTGAELDVQDDDGDDPRREISLQLPTSTTARWGLSGIGVESMIAVDRLAVLWKLMHSKEFVNELH